MKAWIVDDGMEPVLVWAQTALAAMSKARHEHPSMIDTWAYSISLSAKAPATSGLETREEVLDEAKKYLQDMEKKQDKKKWFGSPLLGVDKA